tara:strand:- start:1469 stop:1834 length:366 start_codon:yes stop_codon:yes gene_type:complete
MLQGLKGTAMTADPSLENTTPPKEPSAIVRNLGMIKAAAIIMGVLIIIMTVIVVGTIASRLAKMSAAPEAATIAVPNGTDIRSASRDGSGMLLVVDTPQGQQIWQISASGKRLQTISIISE